MSLNILLIESNEDRHDAIVDYLADRRYRVTACRSAAEAEDKLGRIRGAKAAPDAMVSDAGCLAFYMRARRRFPGMRWILTSTKPGLPPLGNLFPDVVAVPYDASVDQPSAWYPTERPHNRGLNRS